MIPKTKIVSEHQRERRRVKRRRYRDTRKIKRAATMMVESVTTDSTLTVGRVYKVTGERIHFVTVNPPAFADCDCKNSLSPCSHVIAVTKYLTGDVG